MSTVADRTTRDETTAGTDLAGLVPVTPARVVDRARAYVSLMKLRIVELLLVTTVPAMLLAHGGWPPNGLGGWPPNGLGGWPPNGLGGGPPNGLGGGPPNGLGGGSAGQFLGLMAVVLGGGTLAAGAANVLNCYLDRDIDQVMRRTARRALPSHVVPPRGALVFGLSLAAVSVVIMASFTNWLATALTVAAIGYYDLVYTLWLKRTTSLNTVWGGVCGAMPVLIGWAAVTGSLAWPAWVMFAVVFFWQPPHFYALAIRFKDDYARAGIPMLPVVASARRVGAETVAFAWLTVAASATLFRFGLSWAYLIVALAVGGLFILEAHRLYRRIVRQEPARPMRLFHWSTTYLTIVFVTIAVDALLRT